jgi:hypothetical protein
VVAVTTAEAAAAAVAAVIMGIMAVAAEAEIPLQMKLAAGASTPIVAMGIDRDLPTAREIIRLLTSSILSF